MRSYFMLLKAVVALAGLASAAPYHMQHRVMVPQQYYEILALRAATNVNPDAVTGVTCLDAKQNIVFHDQNVAELAICGGIAGSITKCGGNPAATTGQSGTALFTLKTTDAGATINISKGRWEQCIRAARAVCPTGSVSGTCVGGATTGNVGFTLTNP